MDAGKDEQGDSRILPFDPRDPKKPPLVVVATSGGGVVAALWTVACLTRIEAACREFPRRIRIITGASGGMVGAGVYVASMSGKFRLRSDLELERLRQDVSKDSLTPVVSQMILFDLFSILSFSGRQDYDRGKALEDAWAQNTGCTDGSFTALAEGERQGWRPSLVVSPMTVEDAKVLLISNLDLHGLDDGEHFFATYPAARNSLSLGEALRMNASFPLVSPAVYLPSTNPKKPRRVVDAGFRDNYGVSLACAWIDRHKGWLLANTSCVLLLQLRAYPRPTQDNTTNDGWQFLETPAQALMTHRQATMEKENAAKIGMLKGFFNDRPPAHEDGERRETACASDFFKTFELTCEGGAPLGWSLTSSDRKGVDPTQGKTKEVIEDVIRLARDVHGGVAPSHGSYKFTD